MRGALVKLQWLASQVQPDKEFDICELLIKHLMYVAETAFFGCIAFLI